MLEIPNEPVTVFQDDTDIVKVELNFNAEVSNVPYRECTSSGEMMNWTVQSHLICAV